MSTQVAKIALLSAVGADTLTDLPPDTLFLASLRGEDQLVPMTKIMATPGAEYIRLMGRGSVRIENQRDIQAICLMPSRFQEIVTESPMDALRGQLPDEFRLELPMGANGEMPEALLQQYGAVCAELNLDYVGLQEGDKMVMLVKKTRGYRAPSTNRPAAGTAQAVRQPITNVHGQPWTELVSRFTQDILRGNQPQPAARENYPPVQMEVTVDLPGGGAVVPPGAEYHVDTEAGGNIRMRLANEPRVIGPAFQGPIEPLTGAGNTAPRGAEIAGGGYFEEFQAPVVEAAVEAAGREANRILQRMRAAGDLAPDVPNFPVANLQEQQPTLTQEDAEQIVAAGEAGPPEMPTPPVVEMRIDTEAQPYEPPF
jgi:hypothetical protein